MTYRMNSRQQLPASPGEEQQAIALLFGKIYELEMERAQSKIDHFRVLLDKRIIADVRAATNTSKPCVPPLK